MLTIFSAPKPFRGRVAPQQHNAVESWRRVAPDAQVILFGDEEGIGEAAALHGVEHVSTIARNDLGTPLLNFIFREANLRARHNVRCYVNGDIIFLPDFAPSIARVALDKFLLVGERTDLDFEEPIDFARAEWASDLQKRAKESGKLRGQASMDYFAYPAAAPPELPPFPVGRVLWDNWMVYHARFQRIPVIDATQAITVVHQNHDYNHVPGGFNQTRNGVEIQRNWQIVGRDFYQMSIADATHRLTANGVVASNELKHVFRRTLTFPAVTPPFSRAVHIARALRQRFSRQGT